MIFFVKKNASRWNDIQLTGKQIKSGSSGRFGSYAIKNNMAGLMLLFKYHQFYLTKPTPLRYGHFEKSIQKIILLIINP
jgi:hypothetical protein